ncbi:unnamed protein product [Mytilus edulis]|uniref:PH domain-containing protein n=1 Tax=Mytilus edulis TaxID=6550 RepID=A0A8S3SKD6_MYTED|nr:unnamed protein product [Mytilus edulis]
MEGTLKRRISFFTGYQDKWFVLADDGNIKQFERQPTETNQKPKWTMNIILADVTTKDDGIRFVVTASNGRTLKLKAPNTEEREKWITLFKIINEKHFPLIYSKKEDKGGFGAKAEEQNNVVHSEVSSAEKRSQELFKNMSLKPKSLENHVQNYTMVAAIDFGSAYSGTAFSSKSDFTRNPLHICVMEGVGKISTMSTKIPTVLLLNPDKKFEAFGNEAEEKYARLTINDPQYANQCYYFTRFKMQLYNNRNLKKSLTIKDISGKKEMKAVDVFAACIEYLKNATFTRAKEQIPSLEEEDIHWVLTVPAIWTEAARQFMIDAAESGNFVAFLTVTKETLPFKDVEGLVEQNTYKWGTAGTTIFETLLKNSELPERKIWNGILKFNLSDPSVLSSDPAEQIRKVRGEQNRFDRKSPFMLEGGLIHFVVSLWLRKALPKLGKCEDTSVTVAKSISVLEFQFAFYLIGIGVIISFLSLIYEHIKSKFYQCTVTRCSRRNGQRTTTYVKDINPITEFYSNIHGVNATPIQLAIRRQIPYTLRNTKNKPNKDKNY